MLAFDDGYGVVFIMLLPPPVGSIRTPLRLVIAMK